MGESPSADAGAYHHGGDRIPDAELTVEYLKKRYLHADFNRRLDSYETAGLVLTDSEDMTIDALTFFNRFHADRFSDAQAEEIRSIISAALRNRDMTREIPAEPEQPEPSLHRNTQNADPNQLVIEMVAATIDEMLDDTDLDNIQKAEILIDDCRARGVRFCEQETDEILQFAGEHEDIAETVRLISDMEMAFAQMPVTEEPQDISQAEYAAAMNFETVFHKPKGAKTMEMQRAAKPE
ncbi:MAG: hypothetical protein IKI45_10420, partial [Oscillospiraceae bacterium]|nr:hypothetical protein [Oscillospiraceae bacterium]